MRELETIFSGVVKFIARTAEILMKTQSGAIRRLSRTSLWAGLALLSLSVAAVGQDTAPSGEKCQIEASAGFRPWTLPPGRVSADFMVVPENSPAAFTQQKQHMIYSMIFGRLVSRKLMASSTEPCRFISDSTGPSLSFEPFFLQKDDTSNCAINRCLRRLAATIRDLKPAPHEVSDAATSSAIYLRAHDVREPEYLGLGLEGTMRVALQHIYPPDSSQGGFFAFVPDDYRRVSVADFLDWLATQQAALKAVELAGYDRPSVLFEEARPACITSDEIKVDELHIDDHGRGQRSLILIKEGFFKNGRDGIRSDALNALCYPDRAASGATRLDVPEHVSCRLARANDGRWIAVYSKERPVHDFRTMRQLARSVADLLRQEQCVPAGLRIYVVEYLQ